MCVCACVCVCVCVCVCARRFPTLLGKRFAGPETGTEGSPNHWADLGDEEQCKGRRCRKSSRISSSSSHSVNSNLSSGWNACRRIYRKSFDVPAAVLQTLRSWSGHPGFGMNAEMVQGLGFRLGCRSAASAKVFYRKGRKKRATASAGASASPATKAHVHVCPTRGRSPATARATSSASPANSATGMRTP